MPYRTHSICTGLRGGAGGVTAGYPSTVAAIEKARVNLEYMYGFTLRLEGKGLLAFRFDDPDRAIEALQKQGINPVGSVELFKRLEV